MKTCSLYGFIWALAGAFLTLILYFTGFHSDPAKLSAAGWIGGLAGLGIAITCMSIGVKARRSEIPPEADFGYGAALWAGMLISIVASLLSSIFGYVYWSLINPAFADVVVQDQVAKLEARGVSGDKLEKAEAMTRTMAAPVPQAVIALIVGVLFGLVIALIVAAVLKRPSPNTPPTV
jgi:hypothetical protein